VAHRGAAARQPLTPSVPRYVRSTVTRTRTAISREQRQRVLLVVLVLLAFLAFAVALALVQASTARPDAVPTPSATLIVPGPEAPAQSSEAAAALAALDAIPVASERASGYERDAFGSGWLDTDHNGCDTRNDILARDLRDERFRADSVCVVVSGVLDDPYTATVIAFVRGVGTSDDVQIDHLVPLSWAWGYGANTWTGDHRESFANDPDNLRAVEGSANMSKGDSGPSEWLPANAAFRCDYVESFVEVVADYRLSIPDADRIAIRAVLAGC
jgi:hypothetical protein